MDPSGNLSTLRLLIFHLGGLGQKLCKGGVVLTERTEGVPQSGGAVLAWEDQSMDHCHREMEWESREIRLQGVGNKHKITLAEICEDA